MKLMKFTDEEGNYEATSVFDYNHNVYSPRFAFFRHLRSDGRPNCWAAKVEKSPIVWYIWPNPRRLGKIGFSSPAPCPDFTSSFSPRHCFKQSPTAFQVVGANGDGSTWTTLLDVEDAGFTAGDQFQEWVIPPAKRRSFTRFGLRVTSVIGSQGVVSIWNLKMWEDV